MATYIWEIKSTELGYVMECSKCKHKIGVKDAVVGEKNYDECPFCKTKMDMTNLDYDKLYELAQSDHDAIN